jgi:hypothetical protein
MVVVVVMSVQLHEGVDRAALELGERVAEQARGGGVGLDDAAVVAEDEQAVGAGLEDPAVLLLARAQLVLLLLAREEAGDLVAGRVRGDRRLGLEVVLDEPLDARGVGHDEAAVLVALGPARDLGGDQRDVEAGLAPARRVAGVHHADREVGALPLAHPAVALERVGVVVQEVEILVGRGPAVLRDVDEGPAGVRKVDRTGRELGDRILQVHALCEVTRVRQTHRVGDVEEQAARDAPRLGLALVLVEALDHLEEFDAHRARADEHVALAEHLDARLLRDVLALGEEAADVLLGLLEQRLERRWHSNRLQHGAILYTRTGSRGKPWSPRPALYMQRPGADVTALRACWLHGPAGFTALRACWLHGPSGLRRPTGPQAGRRGLVACPGRWRSAARVAWRRRGRTPGRGGRPGPTGCPTAAGGSGASARSDGGRPADRPPARSPGPRTGAGRWPARTG